MLKFTVQLLEYGTFCSAVPVLSESRMVFSYLMVWELRFMFCSVLYSSVAEEDLVTLLAVSSVYFTFSRFMF